MAARLTRLYLPIPQRRMRWLHRQIDIDKVSDENPTSARITPPTARPHLAMYRWTPKRLATLLRDRSAAHD
jgi:hypothetical protein